MLFQFAILLQQVSSFDSYEIELELIHQLSFIYFVYIGW